MLLKLRMQCMSMKSRSAQFYSAVVIGLLTLPMEKLLHILELEFVDMRLHQIAYYLCMFVLPECNILCFGHSCHQCAVAARRINVSLHSSGGKYVHICESLPHNT